jgi:lysozyme family protein
MTHTDIFNKCITVILKNEGGYVNHPNDPGGETNMGIARMFYPSLDIKNLTHNQAIEIYFRDYWSKMNLTDIFNENLVLYIFDFGVNTRSLKYGFNTAIKTIQRIVEAQPDGIIGPETKGLINNYEGDIETIYNQERKKYYFDLARRKPQMQVFLAGWLNRIEHTKF